MSDKLKVKTLGEALDALSADSQEYEALDRVVDLVRAARAANEALAEAVTALGGEAPEEWTMLRRELESALKHFDAVKRA